MYDKSSFYMNYGQIITQSKDDLDKKVDSKIKNYVAKVYNNSWKKYFDELKNGIS
jgi:hypothetical protein